jgi:hypothetical protein
MWGTVVIVWRWGLSDGGVLEEFEIEHRIEGFEDFFSRIEKHRQINNCSVAVATVGTNNRLRRMFVPFAALARLALSA